MSFSRAEKLEARVEANPAPAARTLDDTCLQPGYFHEIALFLAKYTTSSSSTVSTSSIAAPAEKATSEDGSVDTESFELVDTEEGREIKDEGGARSVNLLEKVAEKL